MFDDDDFIEGEGKSLEQLLQDYMAIKNGQSRISLDEDDFEEIIDYFMPLIPQLNLFKAWWKLL